MWIYILAILLFFILSGLCFFFFVLYNFAKAAEEAHKDGWDNPFQ
jgi:hypothetical protein